MSPGETRRLPSIAFWGLVAILVGTGEAARAYPQDGRTPPGGGATGGRGAKGGDRGGPAGIFRTDVPARDVDVIAGRPTRTSVVLSVRTTRTSEGCVEWHRVGDPTWRRTPVRAFAEGVPAEVTLDGLTPDTAYEARYAGRTTGAAAEGLPFAPGDEVRVRTARSPGSPFTFTVQADSHLDVQTQPALYERTLRNVAAAGPDFHVDLGDTFMTDKRRDDFRAALPQYVAQRWYLSLARVPLYLVLGNHDGETGWRDTGSAEDMPHWSNAQRRLHFPDPVPDGFYTGNTKPDPIAGLLRNWYAWEWGDALFVVLDPFWSTREKRGRDANGWSWTLGEAQTEWLAKTLAGSRAKVRFVMIHHLVGGLDGEARGGSEAARFHEWGGRTPGAEGRPETDEFAARRPGWIAPVHELLRRAGPTVVLHGHDHFYAHQRLDGVVYQMVPQPGHPGGDARRMATEYGYREGDFLPSPGHVRVRVSPTEVRAEFVRTGAGGSAPLAEIAHTWTLPLGTAAASGATPSSSGR